VMVRTQALCSATSSCCCMGAEIEESVASLSFISLSQVCICEAVLAASFA
jgi:hypothetical protein